MATRASTPQREIPNGDQFEYAAEKLMLRYYRAIRRRMREEGITQTELADRLGVSQAYVSKLLNHNQNLTIRSLAMLSEAMDAEWEQPCLQPKTTGIQYREFEDASWVMVPSTTIASTPISIDAQEFESNCTMGASERYTGEQSDDYDQPLAA